MLFFDESTKSLLNYAAQITFGDHVWVDRDCSFYYGANIPANSIVMPGSIVYEKIKESNVVVAGNPGVVIKSNVNWTRKSQVRYLEDLIK